MNGGGPGPVTTLVQRRVDVLGAFGTDPLAKGDLVGRLDASRSTIDRALAELREAGLVAAADGGYRRTPTGRLALAEPERLRRGVGGVVEASDLLGGLADDAELDTELLAGARVVEATTGTPEGPRVGVVVYDDADVAGCVLNDTDAAVEWARERFESVRERARPVGGHGGPTA